MQSPFASTSDLSAAAAIFKNPVPAHGTRRNTACHQCRKRKLHNSDMKRPCSTCVRSHNHARAHATDGEEVPDRPECTYGDEPEKQTRPINKVKKLENRIAELETLLEKLQLELESTQNNRCIPSGSSSSSPSVVPEMAAGLSIPSNATNTPNVNFMTPLQPQYDTSFTDQQDLLASLDSSDVSALGNFDMAGFNASSPFLNVNPNAGALIPMSSGFIPSHQLQISDWPVNLPNPAITRHLIHAFFAFHMHAGRLFHGPTFLASLDLPPSDPRFPVLSILHAMCAVGSFYTADIPQPPIKPRSHQADGQYLSADEVFTGRWRQYERRPDSFAEQQATYAKLENEQSIDRGERLLECMQAHIILVYFYLYQARWSEAYLSSGATMRALVPLGLHMSTQLPPNTMTLPNYSEKPPSVIGVEKSALEGELRRNIFWLAYALERQGTSGTNYPMVLDDLDIIQMLPVRGDKFEQAASVPQEERQWAHDKNIFLVHPVSQTDSFTLYIKSVILLSHVKTFSIRIRGMAMVFPLTGVLPNSMYDMPGADPRGSTGFQELDRILLSFPSSFPSYYRHPTQDGTVDPYLFTALSAAYMSQIMLHEPHARIGDPADVSADRIIRAARAILDLTYALGSTSYDLALLDHLAILSWNRCARVLIQTLKVAVDAKDYDQTAVLQAEIAYVHSMLTKAGERMPLAYRYKKMVYDYLAHACGRQFVEPLPAASYRSPRFPATAPWDTTAHYSPDIYSPGTFVH